MMKRGNRKKDELRERAKAIVEMIRKMTPEQYQAALRSIEEWEQVDTLKEIDERELIEGTARAYAVSRIKERRQTTRK